MATPILIPWCCHQFYRTMLVFPFIARFDQPEGSEVLKQGTWTVLFIDTDCPKYQRNDGGFRLFASRKATRLAGTPATDSLTFSTLPLAPLADV